MARPRILDRRIMSKLADKLGKRNPAAINVMVSKKAAKLGISAEAALIVLAKEHGIGTSTYQRGLDLAKQAEVRDALPAIFAPGTPRAKSKPNKATGVPRTGISKKASLKLAIEYLIQDPILLSRCQIF
jgi:hypothetical protein